MSVHLEKQAQIKVEAQVRALLFDKALIIVLAEYSDYKNVFLIENIAEFSKFIKMHNYTIKLEKNK